MKAQRTKHLERRYLRLLEAAEYTGLSVVTLRRRISDGSLPAKRQGRRLIVVDIADLDRLLTPIPTMTASPEAS